MPVNIIYTDSDTCLNLLKKQTKNHKYNELINNILERRKDLIYIKVKSKSKYNIKADDMAKIGCDLIYDQWLFKL